MSNDNVQLSQPESSHPQISVIMPVYNGSRFLRQAVESVSVQTFADWELIIVDDGSTDSTPDLARELASTDSRIRIATQANQGLAHARNSGMSNASAASRYIAFLDSDDLWFPDALATLLARFEQSPSAEAVHGLGHFVDSNGELHPETRMEDWDRNRLEIIGNKRVRASLDRATSFEMMAVRNYITPGTLLVRRSAILAVGGFLTELRCVEDWHYWMRLSLRQPIEFVDKVVLKYRRHDSNMSSNSKAMHVGRFLAAKDLYDNHIPRPEQRTYLLRSQSAVCHLHWAAWHIKRLNVFKAVLHILFGLRSVIDFHIMPRLSPRSQSQT